MYLSEYVLAQQDRDDAVGDLARDAAADDCWPHDSGFGTLSAYLVHGGAGDEVIEVLGMAAWEHRRQGSLEGG